jgi:hypothetical protein
MHALRTRADCLMCHMQAILLEADQQRARAEVEARIAKAEAAGLAHRAAVVEAALDRRTSEWEATKLQHQLLQKSANRHGSVASSHRQQLAALQVSQHLARALVLLTLAMSWMSSQLCKVHLLLGMRIQATGLIFSVV